jgi:hypothetical protein
VRLSNLKASFSFISQSLMIRYECDTVPISNQQRMEQIHSDLVRTARHLVFLPYGNASVGFPENVLAPLEIQIRRIERIL